jgi:hypothetical protein
MMVVEVTLRRCVSIRGFFVPVDECICVCSYVNVMRGERKGMRM